MAVEVASAYVTLLPSARGFQSKLQREISGPAAVEGQRAGTVAGSRFSSGFTATVSRGVRRMFAPIIGGTIRATKYLTIAAGAAGFFGLKTASSLEQSSVAFTTMLGSAREAHRFLRQLQTFARKTPFEFSDVVTASQRLLAFGFTAKQVLPTLTAIGDAAAGLGAGAEGVQRITLAIGQIQAKGKVQSDELLQLTEQGIPALKILANGFGVTTGKMQKMVTKGVVPANKAIPILLKGIEKGTNGLAGKTAKFGGLMDKQSHTLGGIFSNIVDTVSQGLASTVKPLLPVLERELPAAMPILARGLDTVGDGLRDLLVGLGLVRDKTVGAAGLEVFGRIIARDVVPAVGGFLDSGARFAQAIAPMVANLGKLAGGSIVGGLKALDGVMGFLADHSTVAQTALAGIAGLVVSNKLKGLFGLGRGGKAGGLLDRGNSVASPLYVWVVNGGGGPGGMPTPVGGGKGGKWGKVGRAGKFGAGLLGPLGWGALIAEGTGNGPSKAFSLGQAYGLLKDVHKVQREYVYLNTRQQKALDKLDLAGALTAGEQGNLGPLRQVLAEANSAIKRLATTDRDRERTFQKYLLRSQGFTKKQIDAAMRSYDKGIGRRNDALTDARLTKLERLADYPDPTRRRPAAAQPGGGVLSGTGAFTIMVRGDLNVNGGNPKDFVDATKGRHRQRALSGSLGGA